MSSTTPTRTRQPKAVTRAAILEKAYELYLNRELIPGDERLSHVLDSLGYTTGAGYQIWSNQAEFREDLQVYIAENIEYASLRAIAEQVAELDRLELEFDQRVLEGAQRYIKAFLGREEFYISLRFMSMPPDRPAQITDAVIQGYERLTWETVELFKAVLEVEGRRMKPGYDIEHLAVATTALAEGFAIRHRMQPDRISADLPTDYGPYHAFSVSFLGIVTQMVEPDPGAKRR
ncbi:MAG: hypothetical protein AAF547_15705 [Actinomycetota bacterium]